MSIQSSGHQRGFSLIELMVSITLGLIVLAALAALLGLTVRGSTETLRSARLNQDLSAVLEVMANDIRRAGYTDGQVEYDDATRDLALPSTSCLVYSYNRNSDSASGAPDTNIDNAELNGFELRGGAVRMRRACGGAACSTGCGTGAWEAITDPAVITITGLTLTTTGSKCYNLETDSYWITTSDTATSFPCEETDTANLTNYVYDTATGDHSVGAFVAPVTDERTVETRQVNILIRGELTADADVSKQLDVQVKVRNDRLRTTP
jgi:type IV pilus assembly protein PilW